MQLHGKLQELFAAFSRIGAAVFQNDTLLSCPTLSKAPNYGNVLRRHVTAAPYAPLSVKDRFRLACRYMATNSAHLLFLLLARLYIAILGWKLPSSLQTSQADNAPRPLVVIDTFALLPQIAGTGQYTEMYLPGLADAAKKQGMEPVLFFRLYGSRNPAVLWKAFSVLSRMENSLTEVHLYRLRDWCAMLRHIIVYPFALKRLVRSLTHYPQGAPEQAIRAALVQTAGQCILLGEARRLAAFRLGLLLGTKKYTETAPKIISWHENQTVNKAFQRGLRQAKRRTQRHIPVIGTQLFIWPPSLLNNHADDAEAELGLAPDVTVVGGSYFLPENSKQRYVTGPSLRYGYLFAPHEERGTETEKEKKDILVLLSYHPEETQRVLETVLPLANSGEQIVYKFHPATLPEQYQAWLPDNPVFVNGNLQEAIKGTRGVIGSGSGSLVEAVCFGVPALTVTDPREKSELVLNYLPPFGEGKLWAGVSRGMDIPGALDALLLFQQDTAYEAARQEFMAMLFTKPDKDSIRALLHLE